MRPEGLCVVYRDSGLCAAVVDSLVLLIWDETPSDTRITAVRKLLLQRRLLSPQLQILALVRTSEIPNKGTRQALARVFAESSAAFAATAVVIEARGLGAVWLKTMVRASALRRSSKKPFKLAQDVRSAASWITATAPGQWSASEICDAVAYVKLRFEKGVQA